MYKLFHYTGRLLFQCVATSYANALEQALDAGIDLRKEIFTEALISGAVFRGANTKGAVGLCLEGKANENNSQRSD